jgi:hypothetical protein
MALGGPETPIPVTTVVRRCRIAPKTLRLRDKEHGKFVATQPCVVCGRTPTEAHHIRFAQPRALNPKGQNRVRGPGLPPSSSRAAPIWRRSLMVRRSKH